MFAGLFLHCSAELSKKYPSQVDGVRSQNISMQLYRRVRETVFKHLPFSLTGKALIEVSWGLTWWDFWFPLTLQTHTQCMEGKQTFFKVKGKESAFLWNNEIWVTF